MKGKKRRERSEEGWRKTEKRGVDEGQEGRGGGGGEIEGEGGRGGG